MNSRQRSMQLVSADLYADLSSKLLKLLITRQFLNKLRILITTLVQNNRDVRQVCYLYELKSILPTTVELQLYDGKPLI